MKNRVFILFLIFICNPSFAQKKTFKKNEPDTLRVKYWLNEARLCSSKGSDSSLYFADLAKTLSLKIKWTKGVANSYVEVGEYYNSKGNYQLSLNNFIESFRIHDSIKCKHGMSYASNSIGNMYLGWGNLEKALYYYQESYNIAFTDSNKFMMCVSQFGIASIHQSNKNYNEAFKSYSKVFHYIETVPRCKDFLPAYYINISVVLNSLHKNKLAILNIQKALEVLKPTNDLYSLGEAYEVIGSAYSELNMDDSAFYYFDKSEECLLKKGAFDNLQDLYLNISNSYKKKKNYEKALNFFVKHSMYKDSVFNINIAKQVVELERLNENRQIKKEINTISSELSQSKQLILQKKHENKIVYFFLTLLSLSLISIAILFFKNYKKSIILKQKNIEKGLLVQEIHHRVKNNLQFIGAMLKIQLNNIKDEGNRKILKETSRRINAMSLVHEMLYNKGKLEYISLQEYITELVSKLKEIADLTAEPIEYALNIDDVKFDINNCVAIGMITSEIISNAIKYAFLNIPNPTIDIHLEYNESEKKIIYTISDNGIGILEKDNITGIGLRLIDIFSRQMEASYETINDNGLKYVFKIPYTKNEY